MLLAAALALSGCEKLENHGAAVDQCKEWRDKSKAWEDMAGITDEFWMQRCVAKLEPLVPQCKGIATSVPDFCHNAANEIGFEISEEAKANARSKRQANCIPQEPSEWLDFDKRGCLKKEVVCSQFDAQKAYASIQRSAGSNPEAARAIANGDLTYGYALLEIRQRLETLANKYGCTEPLSCVTDGLPKVRVIGGPPTVRISIHTTPPGTEVLEKGVLLGRTPLTFECYKKKIVTVTFKHLGYRDQAQSIRLENDQVLDFALEALAAAKPKPQERNDEDIGAFE